MASSELKVLRRTSSSSSQIPNPITHKIPKIPFFLTTTFQAHDVSKQAQKIQAKLWKFASCNIQQSERQRRTEESFSAFLSQPTFKKSIRSARKIKIILPFFNDFYPQKLFSKSWIPQSLTLITKDFSFFPEKFLKNHISHKISSINLVFNDGSPFSILKEGPKILCFQNFLKKLHKPQNTLILSRQYPHTKAFFGKIRLLSLDSPSENRTLLHPTILLTKESIKNLKITSDYCEFGRIKATFSPFPSFPNLKSLDIKLHGPNIFYQGISFEKLNISSLQKLSRLETFKIFVDRINIVDWDFLLSFKFLANLSVIFKSDHNYYSDFPLPPLKNLKTLTLHIKEDIDFDEESIRTFIKNNTELKSLELRASLQQINLIFQDTTFLSLEKLSIQLCKVQFPIDDYVDDFEDIIKRHNCLKYLHINFFACYSELFCPVVKAIGTYKTSLEVLKIDFERAGDWNDKNYKRLKRLFGKITGLKSLELDLTKEEIEAKVFMKVIEGIQMLKNLERLVLKVKVVNMSKNKEEKLKEFMQSVRGLKEASVEVKRLKEISEEMTSEMNNEEEEEEEF